MASASKGLFAALLWALCLEAGAQSCFGTAASLWNAYSAGDFSSQGNSCDGRIAALGRVTLSNFGVGGKLGDVKCSTGTSNPSTWGLAAGISASLTSSNVNNGHLTSPSISLNAAGVGGSGCTQNRANPTTVLSGVRDTIGRISLSLSKYAPTGSASLSSGKMIMSFSSTSPTVQVVSVTGSSLLNARSFELRGISFTQSMLIVNVVGTSGGYSAADMGAFLGSESRIIWNFWQASTFSHSSTPIRGSVLAIGADASMGDGNVYGQIFVKSYSGSTTLNNAPCSGFNFDVPAPSASASTSAMPSSSPSRSPSPSTSPSISPSSRPSLSPGASSYPSSTATASPSFSSTPSPSTPTGGDFGDLGPVIPSPQPSDQPPSPPTGPISSSSPTPISSFEPCFSIGVDFNVLTFEDFVSSTYVQGRLFVGNVANLDDGFSIGSDLGLDKCKGQGLDDAAQTLLYGGGDVKWGSGTAQSGNIVAASSTGIGSGVFSSLSSFGCRFISSKQVSPFVKGPVRKILRAASTALSKLPSTASKVDFDAGTGQLTVTFRDSAAPVQVVTLDPTVMKQFASMAVVNYNSVSSFMVINVAGKRDVRIEGKILAAQLSAGRTIWNLFEHQGPLVLETTELRGSLLAVDSDLVPAVSAIIIGQAIVRSTGVPSSSVFSSLNADGTALIPAPANESEISALSGDAQQLSKLEFKQKQCIGLPIMRLFPNLDEDGSFTSGVATFKEQFGAGSRTGGPVGGAEGADGLSPAVLGGIGAGAGVIVLGGIGLAVWARLRYSKQSLDTVFKKA